jgi:hypothetical protein
VTAVLGQPLALVAVYVWSFGVLAAAQLTIRLIMAFSVRLTAVAAAALTLAALAIGAVYDGVFGTRLTLATRIELAPFAMLLMAVAGFLVARSILRIRRLRGQIIAGLMVGLLDPHLFALLSF